jgi:cardiolipin synthase
MERMYLDDLSRSTEVILTSRKVKPTEPRSRRRRGEGAGQGSARGVVTSVMRAGNTLGAVITSRRALGPSEAVVMVSAAVLLLLLAGLAILWPMAVIVPLTLFSTWVAVSLLIRAYRLYRARKAPSRQEAAAPGASAASK